MPGKKPRGRPRHDDVLTPAEWRIAHAAQHGMSNREIARRRGISIDAIKFHLKNVFAKLNLAGRGQLKQWFEAPSDSALRREKKAMNKSRVIESVGQISRSVSDIQASERWYKETLGLKHLYTFDKLAFFDCGGTRLYLNQREKVSQDESILYFRVADIQSAYRQLQERGAVFTNAPHRIHQHDDGTEEWMAFFEDLDGRPLGIMSQVGQKPVG